MPTYQYACTQPDCGNRFELVQSFTEPSASKCPVCTGAVRKVYGSVGVVFKGSGFYRNDSRPVTSESDGGTAAKSEAKSESKSDAKSDGKSDGKSESKSDGKSESKTASKADSGSSSSASSAASTAKSAASA
jgi:putative FmdB family regulatory protein